MNPTRDNLTPFGVSILGIRTSVLATGSLALALWMHGAVAMAAQGADAQAAPAGAAVSSTTTAAPAAGTALRATFIDVTGNVKWRANASSPWQDAKLSEEVPAGVEVRSGLRSHAALRVGRNATILVDAGTVVSIPEVMDDGQTLKTTAVVKSGRADFKVDHVGLANDFRVVTPSTTLAVRGTEFAVATGPLMQVEVVGARTNVINAIELRYALNNAVVQMSGAASSKSGVQNPAHVAAVVSSAPTTASAAPETTQEEVVQNAAAGPSPSQAGSSTQAVKSNRNANKDQAIEGNVGFGVTSTVQTAIDLANARTAQAIEYLMGLQGEAGALEAQRATINALRNLAGAHRAAAMSALAAHQAALVRTQLADARTNAAQAAFAQRSTGLTGSLNAFNQDRSQSQTLLGSIQALLNEGKSSNEQLMDLAHQAHDALGGMNDSFNAAAAYRDGMAANLGTVQTEINALNAGVRASAAQSISAYQAAVAGLQSAVNSGASAAQVAEASHAAVVRLQALISELSHLAPTNAALHAAASALNALYSANSALANAQNSLAAIRAARAAATDDVRAAALGQIELIYARIVEVRGALTAQLLAANGLISSSSALLASTNGMGEDVFASLGNHFATDAHLGADASVAARNQAQGALAAANAAANTYNGAVVGAEGIAADLGARNGLAQAAGNDVAAAHATMTQQSLDASGALARLLDVGVAERYQSALVALNALNSMEGTLLALTSRYADLTGALQGSPTSSDLAPFQAAATQAIQAILAAASNAAAADGSAASAAAQAASSAGAALDLQSLASDLASRFGLSDALVSAAARAAAASAAGAHDAASAAAAARGLVDQLAMIAQADRMGQVVAQIDALLASNTNLSAQALHDLNAARAEYVATNEYGTVTFGTLTQRTATDAAGQQNAAQSSMLALQTMATTSTQYVAALDGAENSANSAERAYVGAQGQRVIAEAHESATNGYFGRTQTAVASGDLAGASAASQAAGASAGAAAQAAGAAAGFANTAATEAVRAENFGKQAENLRPDIEKFGTNRAAYAAAAAASRMTVESANAALSAFKDQAQFYDSVAQMLSGRAGTAAALAAAAASGDAREQVFAIAVQLSQSAADARNMEQTASTNAGRMFGRSARLYVERAQTAAFGALNEANRAASAAERAGTTAGKANELVQGAGGGN